MSNRDCENCAYARPFSENSNRCTAWDCEFVPRKEAIRAWKNKRHGHWIYEKRTTPDNETITIVKCSECEWEFPIFETPYCPYCGAKMKGASDETD